MCCSHVGCLSIGCGWHVKGDDARGVMMDPRFPFSSLRLASSPMLLRSFHLTELPPRKPTTNEHLCESLSLLTQDPTESRGCSTAAHLLEQHACSEMLR